MFQINAETLPPPEASPYLGRTIAYNNNYWLAVYLNLRKERRRWGMIVRVLERTGAMVRARGAMYKVVVQSVLLYCIDSWLVTGEMLKVLTEFHHWAAQRIKGITAKHGAGGYWDYPVV